MIDNFALGLSHGLLMLAAWILVRRRALDDENPANTGGWRRKERTPGA